MKEELSYKMEDETIIINRKLTKLDLILKKFLSVLKKYSKYLVVGGFVSICVGRSRATEDIDILFSSISSKKFKELFKDLLNSGFYCFQGDTWDVVYPYVKSRDNIRFSRKNKFIPSFDLVPVDASRKAKFFELNNPQKVKIEDFEFLIPPLEFEIAYKEKVLGSKKDLEDAKHLRTFFSKIIKEEKIKGYKDIVKREIK